MYLYIQYKLTFDSTNIWRKTVDPPKQKDAMSVFVSSYINNNIH